GLPAPMRSAGLTTVAITPPRTEKRTNRSRNRYSQELDNYIVITYEWKVTPSQHGTKLYYRVARTDSIQNMTQYLPPLYFEGFATQALRECCSNSSSEIFSLRQNSDFDFDNSYILMMSKLKNVIDKNRVKVQKIDKSWPNGHRERITVYATPIVGKMCTCKMTGYDTLISKYEGVFYMPLSDFSLDNKLWENRKLFYKTVLRDYSITQISTGF
ncbi:hypothetical protein, partial [Hymenobacter amundsenii]|uniref:hypothetical protein n=1 Tax=Hymenobacter amundsenii TaxID=2006685 RepID=UPI0013FE3612